MAWKDNARDVQTKQVDLFRRTLIEAHFDAALLDLNLNGVRSYPVADLLAARGVPFATSYGGHGSRDGDRDRPLLVKPFETAPLGALLAGLLSAPK